MTAQCPCGGGWRHEDWHQAHQYWVMPLGDVFRDYLMSALAERPAPAELAADAPEARYCNGSTSQRWVMSEEWAREARRVCDVHGRPAWEPSCILGGPDLLLGLPMETRSDGGVPHLEN